MNIQENIPLAPYTTFKIGGPARFFCEAKSEEKILEALKFAREKNLSVFVLGGGSNVLVSDKGFDGLVIKIKLSAWRLYLHDGDSISILTCDAGCVLSKIVSESVKAGLTGLEWAAGIPGTIGGAVRGNAGARALGGEMADAVESVKVLDVDDLQIKTYDLRMCEYEYRNSVFKQNSNLIILSAKLKLKKGDKAASEKKIQEILTKRKEKQPMEFPSPGSFFKNPLVKDKKLIQQFETDTGQKIRDDKIPAPWLIEEAGLKGQKNGGAMVSEKHANFIVNTGKATAEDVITLAAIIKTKVRNKFGIQLQEEVQMVGF
ncbi:MAG: UDP-N-acetylmuramate dehydrogenase [Candidatus Moranbacteria bacterium]|nr:UDP-N-acetylmuramate dehydrogenase [Candidatus Moranbacteria bacterium]